MLPKIPALPIWIIVTAVLFVILVLLFRTMNQVYLLSLIKKNFFYFFIVGVFLFLTISLTSIHSTYDIDFTTLDGVVQAGRIYFSWLSTVFSNMVKVTGYAVNQDWTNATNPAG